MCSVWNAPATLSGISRAFGGGKSASAAAAPSCPPRRSVRHRCRSPGQAVSLEGGEHLVAVAAEDGGHPRRGGRRGLGHGPPALGTKTIACSAVRTPASAAAAISPTLWPDMAPIPKPSAGCGNSDSARRASPTRPAVVARRRYRGWRRSRRPCRSGTGRFRRRTTAEPAGRRRSPPPATAWRKPEFCAPCPGATMTSTPSSCRVVALRSAATRTKTLRHRLLGSYK